MQIDRHFVADVEAARGHGATVIDAVITPVDFGLRFDAEADVAARILDRAGHGEGEGDRFRHAFEREIAVQHVAVLAFAFDAGALESHFGELGDFKEIRIAQMGIAWRNASVNAFDLGGEFDRRLGDVRRVVIDRAFVVFETTRHPVDFQMADGETDRAVRRINLISAAGDRSVGGFAGLRLGCLGWRYVVRER